MTLILVNNTLLPNKQQIKPKAGDIIGFRRRFYTHYAYHIGGNRCIHKDNANFFNKSGSSICIRQLNEIYGEPYIANYDFLGWEELSYVDSLRLGLKELGNQHYNLFSDNCEHFVTHIKFNKKYSKQVKDIQYTSIGAVVL
jgi:Lecithin retinol acyltransferase